MALHRQKIAEVNLLRLEFYCRFVSFTFFPYISWLPLLVSSGSGSNSPFLGLYFYVSAKTNDKKRAHILSLIPCTPFPPWLFVPFLFF